MFPLLDGYRAIAALAVLTTHVAFNTGEILNPVFGTFLGRLDVSVTVFFLLSGFLLYRPWAVSALVNRPGPALGAYALRRTGRIFPAYWLMVVVTLALLPEIQPVRPEAWLVHLGMLHIYLPGFTLEGLTQTWSLATEVAFYALLPLLAFVMGRRHRGDVDRSSRYQWAVLAGFVLLAWTFNAIRLTGTLGDITLSGFWLPGFIDWFALGMAMAVVSARLSRPDPPAWMTRLQAFARDTGTSLVIAAALFIILATPIAGPVTFTLSGPGELLVKHIGFAAIAFFLLLPGFLGDPDDRSIWSRLLKHPVVVYLGTISYGIFLWHLVLLRLIFEVFDIQIFSGGFIPILLATLAVSIAAGTLSWYLIERPVQRWTHRRTSVPLPQPSPAP